MNCRPHKYLRCFSVLLLAFLMAAPPSTVHACTWFGFLNDKNNAFIGRTMEWPGDLGAEIAQVPRGHKLGDVTAEYGFVGMYHSGIFSDGLNEHGVAISALWLKDSVFVSKGEGVRKNSDLVHYVLGNTKNVDEALAFIRKNKFYAYSPKVLEGMGLTIHFAITDATGRSVVVEFVKEGLKVYENKVGVMTNTPTYDKHLKIWSAYDPSKFSEETFESFDYSPEGRFCRMASFNATQAAVPDDAAAVSRAWSMLNTVDIPQGILYWRWVNDSPQFTSYAVVVDLKNRVYYLRTYDNYDVRKIDLNKVDFSAIEFKSVSVYGKTSYRDVDFK